LLINLIFVIEIIAQTLKKTVFTSKPDSFPKYLKKVWDYRRLIGAFAERDIKVKYAHTFLGLSWSIVQPLTGLLVFSLVLGYLFNWEADNLPYTVYLLSGLMGWNFFSYIVHAGSNSIQESSDIIKKVYFPKSILPLSKVVVASVELLIAFTLLIPLMMYFGIFPSWKLIFLPFIILFNAFCGLSLVFLVSVFAHRKRDLYHLLPFIVYFGVWLTPVFFTLDFYPDQLVKIVQFNPMAIVVQSWRWVLFDKIPFQGYWILVFIIIAVLTFISMYLFNRKENSISDNA
jgi:lipopolysaccharide transport system permease protein